MAVAAGGSGDGGGPLPRATGPARETYHALCPPPRCHSGSRQITGIRTNRVGFRRAQWAGGAQGAASP